MVADERTIQAHDDTMAKQLAAHCVKVERTCKPVDCQACRLQEGMEFTVADFTKGRR
jgi:hypothetical protein